MSRRRLGRRRRTGRTSVPALGAGNVIDRALSHNRRRRRIRGAIALNADLVDDDVRSAVRDLDHGLPPSPTTNIHPKEPA